MRWILLVAVVSFSFGALYSQPLIFINDSNIVNFGVMMPKTLDTTLNIYNKGNTDLKIFSTAATCTCTSLRMDKGIILPNDSAKLFFKIDLNSADGNKEYHVVVASNDSNNIRLDIPIRIFVARDLKSIPRKLPIRTKLHNGDTLTYQINLTNTGTEPIEIGNPISTNLNHFIILTTLPLDDRIIPNGESKTFTIAIKLTSGKLLSSDLEIPTTSKLLPILRYTVFTAADLKNSK